MSMTGAAPLDVPAGEVVPLDRRAAENLRFIRETMERAGSFTAVPGRGMVAVGFTALLATVLAPPRIGSLGWLTVWLTEAAIAAAVGAVCLVRKARSLGFPLLSGPARRFFLAFSPPLLVGAVLTAVAVRHGLAALLPGIWLLLYGTAVLCGGALSVRIVPLMGVSFLLLGMAALFAPATLAAPSMAIGFGGLHVVYGVLIARRYGG